MQPDWRRGQKVPFFIITVDTEVVKLKIADWLEEKFRQQPEFFLVEIKIQGRKVSVFIDGDNGIPIAKCAEYSRWIERHLDGEMLLGDNYILEVSSPGMDNPFRLRRQYKNAVGKEVCVVKLDGIRVDGILKDAGEIAVTIETSVKEKGKTASTVTSEILLTDIKSTKLKINF